MFKFFIVTLLAIHCNCQKLVEIGDGINGRAVKLSTGPQVSLTGINGIQTLRTVGGISSIGVHPYGVGVVSPATYGLNVDSISGLQTIGGLRHYGVGAYGLGLGHLGLGLGLRPAAVNYFSAVQPAVQQVAVAQPAISTVVAQPAAIAVRPEVQTVAVAQPALYSQTVVAQQQPVPVSAAIHQTGRTVEYKPVPFADEPIIPQVVEVEPSDIPLHIHFKSRSSTIQLSQEHIPGAPGTVEQTSSQDEPSKVIHEVVKPVIQEVREVIQPYRQLSQEIQPVVENVHTVVAKGEGERRQFVAQQYIPRTVQTVEAVQPVAQVQTLAQPIAQRIAVAQPVAQIQTVAQPVVQTVAQPFVQTVAQPVVQTVAQPVVQAVARPYAIGAVAQPIGVAQAYRSIAQPVVGVAQTYNSVVQPSVFAVHQQQPAVATVFGSGALRQDIVRPVGVSVLSARSQPLGSISYSRTYAEAEQK